MQRKPFNLAHSLLKQWCYTVMRSKLEPVKVVAVTVRRHRQGVIARSWSHQPNGFIEAANGLFQSAKKKARGYPNR